MKVRDEIRTNVLLFPGYLFRSTSGGKAIAAANDIHAAACLLVDNDDWWGGRVEVIGPCGSLLKFKVSFDPASPAPMLATVKIGAGVVFVRLHEENRP